MRERESERERERERESWGERGSQVFGSQNLRDKAPHKCGWLVSSYRECAGKRNSSRASKLKAARGFQNRTWKLCKFSATTWNAYYINNFVDPARVYLLCNFYCNNRQQHILHIRKNSSETQALAWNRSSGTYLVLWAHLPQLTLKRLLEC